MAECGSWIENGRVWRGKSAVVMKERRSLVLMKINY
jgi:hypothetical protein